MTTKTTKRPACPRLWCAGELCSFVSVGAYRQVAIPLLADGWTVDKRRWAVDAKRRLWMSSEVPGSLADLLPPPTDLFLVSREV